MLTRWRRTLTIVDPRAHPRIRIFGSPWAWACPERSAGIAINYPISGRHPACRASTISFRFDPPALSEVNSPWQRDASSVGGWRHHLAASPPIFSGGPSRSLNGALSAKVRPRHDHPRRLPCDMHRPDAKILQTPCRHKPARRVARLPGDHRIERPSSASCWTFVAGC